jgi:hypothetical protein
MVLRGVSAFFQTAKQKDSQMIFAIDPGPTHSAMVLFDDCERKVVLSEAQATHDTVMFMLAHDGIDKENLTVACEGLQCFGMAVGKETFETGYNIGEIRHLCKTQDIAFQLVFRGQVKQFLCHSAKAKDGNIRQAILDSFPATGGGATPQVGTKKAPGPLLGVSSHSWSALAVALYAAHYKLILKG